MGLVILILMVSWSFISIKAIFENWNDDTGIRMDTPQGRFFGNWIGRPLMVVGCLISAGLPWFILFN